MRSRVVHNTVTHSWGVILFLVADPPFVRELSNNQKLSRGSSSNGRALR